MDILRYSISVSAVLVLAMFYPIDGYQSTGIKRLKRLEKTIDSTLVERYLKLGSFKKK